MRKVVIGRAFGALAGDWVLNTLGGLWLHQRDAERAGAYLLFGATVFVQALVWVAAIGLLTAGRAMRDTDKHG